MPFHEPPVPGVPGKKKVSVENLPSNEIPGTARPAPTHAIPSARLPRARKLPGVPSTGGLNVLSMSNSAAPKLTLYYSTDSLKLVWKDDNGIIHNLY